MSDTDQALHALLRLQKKLIGRGSGASCYTDVKIVKIREEFKTIKDTMTRLERERDEARKEYCMAQSHVDEEYGKTTLPEEIAEERGWDCFNKNPTGNA